MKLYFRDCSPLYVCIVISQNSRTEKIEYSPSREFPQMHIYYIYYIYIVGANNSEYIRIYTHVQMGYELTWIHRTAIYSGVIFHFNNRANTACIAPFNWHSTGSYLSRFNDLIPPPFPPTTNGYLCSVELPQKYKWILSGGDKLNSTTWKDAGGEQSARQTPSLVASGMARGKRDLCVTGAMIRLYI